MAREIKNFQKLIDVNIPIIYIDDYDFVRIDELIKETCGKNEIKEWNPASGYTNFISKEPINKEISLKEFLYDVVYGADFDIRKPEIIVLREVSSYLDDPIILSLLSHIAQRKLYDRNYDATIILSDYGLTIPPQLLPYVSFLNMESPDDEEINRLIEEHLEENDFDIEKFTPEDRAALMPSLRGLSLFEIDRVLDMAISVNGSLGDEDKEMILQQKKAQVK